MKPKKQNPFLLAAITVTVTAMLSVPTLHAADTDGTWLGNSGNWSDPAVSGGTWSGGTIADGTGFTAFFTGVDIAADQIITLTAPQTIGNITFTDTTASHNLLIDSTGAANALTLDVASGAPQINVTNRTLTISSVIAGNEGLTKIGAGALTLSGDNTYSGVTTVDGTGLSAASRTLLTVSHDKAFGSTTGGTKLIATVAASNETRMILSTGITVSGEDLTIDSTGGRAVVRTDGTAAWAGNVTIDPNAGGFLQFTANGVAADLTIGASASDTFTLNGSATFRGTGLATLKSTVQGSGGILQKIDAGTLVLTAANTHTSNTTVNGGGTGGVVRLANSLAIQDSTFDILTTGSVSALTFDSAVVSNAFTIGGLSAIANGNAKNIALQNTAATAVALTVGGNDQDTTYNGVLSADGSLTKTGTGNLTLGGTNTYTGATTISDGTLTIAGSIAASGSILNNAALVYDLNANASAYGNAISGTGSLTKIGTNTLTLSGTNTYTGGTTVNNGSLSIAHNNALGTTAGATDIGPGTASVTLNLNSATADLTVAEDINFIAVSSAIRARLENTSAFNHTLGGNISVDCSAAGSITEWNCATAGSITVSGDITGTIGTGSSFIIRGNTAGVGGVITGNVTLTGGGISKADGGTWTLGSPGKTYTAPVIATNTGILKMGAANYLASTTILQSGNSTTSGGTFDLNGFSQTVAGLTTGNSSATAKIITSSTGTPVLTVGDANNYSPHSSLALTGSLSLTKQGAGALTLAGANTYSGNTTVSQGTLTLSNAPDPLNANTGNDASTVTISDNGTSFLNLTYTGTDKVDKLFIGTNQQLPGVYGKLGSISPVIGIAQIKGDGTLTVGGGFSSWITLTFDNGQVPEGQRGANQDPDNDGISNLVEYAIAGQDPTVPNATIGTFTGTSLSFAKRLDATGLTYAIQQSIDLGIGDDWTEVTGGTYVNDTDEISYGFTPGAPAKNFFRLQVESN